MAEITEEGLAKEITGIYDHIKETAIDAFAPELLTELNWCNAHLARSAQLMADAKKFLQKKQGDYAERHHDALKATGEKFQATLFKYLVDNHCKDQESLYLQAERLNRTLTHRIDSIRTAISFEKSIAERGAPHNS